MNFLSIMQSAMDCSNFLISDPAFKNRSVASSTAFTRKRKMDFGDYIRVIAYSGRQSMQSKLYSYTRQTLGEDISYSKQAFSRQRQFIRPEAFLELFYITVERFYLMADYETFHGFLVAAIDGSRYNLPNTPELEALYGAQTSSGESQVQALGSCMYDVLNGMILHCLFEHCRSSERDLAERHMDTLDRIPCNDFLMLFDRGYPSYELIRSLENRKLHYIMRCSAEFIKAFKLEGEDCIVTHRFSANREDPVKMRVITLTLPSGEKTYLITDLFDECYTAEEFEKLYLARWGIETKYNDLKNKLEIENFSGISDVAIRQDYFATMYLSNLAAIMAFELRDEIERARRPGNKYQYKLNMNQAIAELRANVIGMVLEDSPERRDKLIAQIVQKLRKAVVPVRPNRSFKRKKRHKSLKHPQNMKRA